MTPLNAETGEELVIDEELKAHWREMGKYYGYPECCIEAFVETAFTDRRDPRIDTLCGKKGFVPCSAHLDQIERGEIALDDLIKDRQHPFPFPEDMDVLTTKQLNMQIARHDRKDLLIQPDLPGIDKTFLIDLSQLPDHITHTQRTEEKDNERMLLYYILKWHEGQKTLLDLMLTMSRNHRLYVRVSPGAVDKSNWDYHSFKVIKEEAV